MSAAGFFHVWKALLQDVVLMCCTQMVQRNDAFGLCQWADKCFMKARN